MLLLLQTQFAYVKSNLKPMRNATTVIKRCATGDAKSIRFIFLYTCNTQKKLNDRLRFKVIFVQTTSIGQKQRKHVTKKRVRRHAHSDTAYQVIILHFTFLVFVFLQIDKINIYDRQTTMRNEIHLKARYL